MTKCPAEIATAWTCAKHACCSRSTSAGTGGSASGSASFTFAFGQISPQKTQTVHVPGPCVASSKAQTQVAVYVSGQTLKKKISVTSSNQLQRAYFQVNMAKTDQLERLQNQKTVEGCHGWLYGPHTVQRAWMKG